MLMLMLILNKTSLNLIRFILHLLQTVVIVILFIFENILDICIDELYFFVEVAVEDCECCWSITLFYWHEWHVLVILVIVNQPT